LNRWFSSFFGSKGKKDLSGDNLPWLDSPSIYDHISRHIDSETGRLPEAHQLLPDEDRRTSGMKFKWAPGALDGAFGHHWAPQQDANLIKQVSQYIRDITIKNSRDAKISIYKILLQDDLLGFIDESLEIIAASVVHPTTNLHEFAHFLAKTAPDRGPVKFAIALLGIIRDPSDIALVSFLGCHEEFTLYSAVALSNMLENPEKELWALAQKVDGWGRIHLVERLASTSSPEIKAWLLREGYQNQIMYEYLAYSCAVGGDLRGALSGPDIDDGLLLAAGDLIKSLIIGGPAKDIKDYADAAEVILRYLRLLDNRASTVDQFLTVDAILGYLTEKWDVAANFRNGWNEENRDQAIVLANLILQNPFWQEIVRKALQAKEDTDYYPAAQAADLLGIDTWDYHWNRLVEDPLDSGRWFYVMKKANRARIDQIVQLALTVLPLEQVATGPSNELGLGPAFQVHQCLDCILQDLKLFPRKGWALIAAGLKSPVIRNRHMALNALSAWGKESWPEEAESALLDACQVEPEHKVKERIEKLIKDGRIDD
jgi:hypothetical protein